jgi:hypothetical protein
MTVPPETALTKSGFLLQLAVESYVDRNSFNWKAESREHAWMPKGKDTPRFIDLILRNEVAHLRLVVECKKRDKGTWIFLVPEGSAKTEAFRCCWFSSRGGPLTGEGGYWDGLLEPRSFESEFCIISGSEDREPTLLETTAADLVAATEALLLEVRGMSWREVGMEDASIAIPTIVTSAKLLVHPYSKDPVNMRTGIPANTNKSLTFNTSKKPTDLAAANRERQRSILVVNSNHLYEILSLSAARKPWDE